MRGNQEVNDEVSRSTKSVPVDRTSNQVGLEASFRAHSNCRAPLLEKCPQHHGHKGDPEVTPGTCGAIGERAEVILVWMRSPGHWKCLPPTETRSHKG